MAAGTAAPGSGFHSPPKVGTYTSVLENSINLVIENLARKIGFVVTAQAFTSFSLVLKL